MKIVKDLFCDDNDVPLGTEENPYRINEWSKVIEGKIRIKPTGTAIIGTAILDNEGYISGYIGEKPKGLDYFSDNVVKYLISVDNKTK